MPIHPHHDDNYCCDQTLGQHVLQTRMTLRSKCSEIKFSNFDQADKLNLRVFVQNEQERILHSKCSCLYSFILRYIATALSRFQSADSR